MKVEFQLASFYFFYFAIIAIHIIFLPKILELEGFSGSEIGFVYAAAPLVRFIIPFAFIKGLKLNNTIFNFALILLFFSAISFYLVLDSFAGLIVVNTTLGIGLSLPICVSAITSIYGKTKERPIP
ncbi:MAG: MFS transporter, partial [Campylobacterota bacterium]|nr:MFS transporter [Campylobacterota bacterium]